MQTITNKTKSLSRYFVRQWASCCVSYLIIISASMPCAAQIEASAPKTAQVRGIVTDIDGKPVQGTEITAIQVVQKPHTREKQVLQTAEDGTFCFSVIPQERVHVSCTAPDGWQTRVSSRWIAPDSETLHYVVRKTPGNEDDFAPVKKEVLIRGRVLDSGGRPVVNAPVIGLSDLSGAICETGKEGVFELRHPVVARWDRISFLRFNLYVDLPAMRMGRCHQATFNERWEYNLDLQLRPYREARGSVTDKEGKPVAGISILRRNHLVSLEWKLVTWTDEEGQFMVDDLIPDAYYSFCALSETYGTPQSGPVYWSEDETSIPLIQVLPRTGSVEGVVQDGNGSGFAKASVTLEPCLGERYELLTDSRGHFQCAGLVAGEIEIRARKQDDETEGEEFLGWVKCSSGDREIRLILAPICTW